MSKITEEGARRLFDVTEGEVIAGAGCTYCGVGVGYACLERDTISGKSHAQRWRDYWNATHDRAEEQPVYPARWLA